MNNTFNKVKFIVPVLSLSLLASCGGNKGLVQTSDVPETFHANLKQKVVTSKTIQSGLTYTKTAIGHVNPKAYFHLSNGIVARDQAEQKIRELKYIAPDAKYTVKESPEAALDSEDLGVIIHVGEFKTKKEAEALARRFKNADIKMSVRYSEEDGYADATGPFNVHMLTIDPTKFKGKMITALSKNIVPGKETTSSLARRKHAIAATNAGFFVFKKSLGTDGAPAGMSVINGTMVAEPVNHRPTVVFDNRNHKLSAKIYHNVVAYMKARVDGHNIVVDGVNRQPGKSLNCGNIGDTPLTTPAHDFLCTDSGEVIAFNKYYGRHTAIGKGMEVVYSHNKIDYISSHRGHYLRIGQKALQFTGDMATKLKALHLHKKDKIGVALKLMSDEGRIRLRKGMYAANGGPSLVKNGQLDFASRLTDGFAVKNNVAADVKDEFVDKKDQSSSGDTSVQNRAPFYYGWVLRRHPRTAIGIKKDGTILLAVMYGRQPGVEGGATVTEMSQLLKSQGAYNAMNLDGGGSTMMVVKGKKTGKSSDKRERPDADAILILRK